MLLGQVLTSKHARLGWQSPLKMAMPHHVPHSHRRRAAARRARYLREEFGIGLQALARVQLLPEARRLIEAGASLMVSSVRRSASPSLLPEVSSRGTRPSSRGKTLPNRQPGVGQVECRRVDGAMQGAVRFRAVVASFWFQTRKVTTTSQTLDLTAFFKY